MPTRLNLIDKKMSRTLHQILKSASSKITSLDAELLIAHVVNQPREFVMAHPEMRVGRLKDWQIKRLLKKRLKGIPLAYLTRHKEFYGLNFGVDKHTLVPRPETELLVSLALDKIEDWKIERLKDCVLIDVGTGTGCIPISIQKTIKQYNNITIYATDISKKALRIAKKNARCHNTEITFFRGNLLAPIIKHKFIIHNSKFIILTANLPYLTAEQYAKEPSIQHEPKSALVAKNNGLALYEELIKQINNLQLYNLQLTTLFEIDPSQSSAIQAIVKQHFPTAKIEIKKDLSGLDRVVCIKI
jgi:release factor glutamine methyltransferase